MGTLFRFASAHHNAPQTRLDHASMVFSHLQPGQLKRIELDAVVGDYVVELFSPIDDDLADHLALEEIA